MPSFAALDYLAFLQPWNGKKERIATINSFVKYEYLYIPRLNSWEI